MELDRYDFVTSKSGFDYMFVSKGPNGKIIKLVRFRPTYINGLLVFNLAFGDWNEKSEQLDDLSISNNNDVKKYWQPSHTLFWILQNDLEIQLFMQKAVPLQEQDCIKWE